MIKVFIFLCPKIKLFNSSVFVFFVNCCRFCERLFDHVEEEKEFGWHSEAFMYVLWRRFSLCMFTLPLGCHRKQSKWRCLLPSFQRQYKMNAIIMSFCPHLFYVCSLLKLSFFSVFCLHCIFERPSLCLCGGVQKWKATSKFFYRV